MSGPASQGHSNLARQNQKAGSDQRNLFTDKQLRSLIAGSDLTPTQRATLTLAADALARSTLIITASLDRLAELFGVSRRAAISRMQSLEDAGVLTKIRGGGGRAENGQGYVNKWRLEVHRLQPNPNKGDASDTVKDADNRLQGCRETTPTVQPVAQDPTSSTNQEKIPKRRAASPAPAAQGGGGSMPLGVRDLVKPWIHGSESTEIHRAKRLKKIKADLMFAEAKHQNSMPTT